MWIPLGHLSTLVTRQIQPQRDESSPEPNLTKNAVIGIIIFFSLVIAFVLIYFCLRSLRNHYDHPPKWLPAFLKARWKRWNKPGRNGPTATYSRARLEDNDPSEPTPGVDRTQSVRSIMTLPEYRPIANPDKERTIAREGERAGMDVVIEFPETQDEEEARRETHMQTLYEIRLARAAEREARRARREARRRGETVPNNRNRSASSTSTTSTNSTLAPPQFSGGGVNSMLDVEAGQTPGSNPAISPLVAQVISSRSASSLAALIAEPPGRLPQVSYADLGTARPDGTRLRAGSNASDRQGLLDSAASMGAHSRQGSSSSSINTGGSFSTPYDQAHARSASNLSITSYPTLNSSSQTLSLTPGRGSNDTLARVGTGASSRQSADLTDMRPDPPSYGALQYEPAPPYDSPITTRLEVPDLVVSTPGVGRQSLVGPSGDLTSPNSVNLGLESMDGQLGRT